MAKFSPTRASEQRFARNLRKVARVVGGIVNAHIDGVTIRNEQALTDSLKAYSESLTPWASKVVTEMLRDVFANNLRAWQTAFNRRKTGDAATYTAAMSKSKKIGEALRRMMNETATGTVAKLLHNRQVDLIKSLPIQAGERAQRLAREAAMNGERTSEIAEELLRTESVTAARAELIARTEISKANAAITQARAEYIGATQYIWETAEDGDVRESHSEMEGTIQEFANPPTLSDGMTGNPGEFPNCRCFASVVIPPEYEE